MVRSPLPVPLDPCTLAPLRFSPIKALNPGIGLAPNYFFSSGRPRPPRPGAGASLWKRPPPPRTTPSSARPRPGPAPTHTHVGGGVRLRGEERAPVHMPPPPGGSIARGVPYSLPGGPLGVEGGPPGPVQRARSRSPLPVTLHRPGAECELRYRAAPPPPPQGDGPYRPVPTGLPRPRSSWALWQPRAATAAVDDGPAHPPLGPLCPAHPGPSPTHGRRRKIVWGGGCFCPPCASTEGGAKSYPISHFAQFPFFPQECARTEKDAWGCQLSQKWCLRKGGGWRHSITSQEGPVGGDGFGWVRPSGAGWSPSCPTPPPRRPSGGGWPPSPRSPWRPGPRSGGEERTRGRGRPSAEGHSSTQKGDALLPGRWWFRIVVHIQLSDIFFRLGLCLRTFHSNSTPSVS